VHTSGLDNGKTVIWKDRVNKLATEMIKTRRIWENSRHTRGDLSEDSNMAREFTSGVKTYLNTQVTSKMGS
jgi:hypothetical protein